jgi:HSP20 family protein
MPQQLVGDPPFGHFARQMSRSADPWKLSLWGFRPDETWAPNVNLYESEASYLVCVDIAGVDREKLDVSVADGRLRIRGQRAVPVPPQIHDPATASRVRMHLMEIDHGHFSREVELPADVEQDRIEAQYLNGLLWVQLPKRR